MNKVFLGAVAIGGGILAYQRVVRPWWQSWGIRPDDVARPLAGDDLVPMAPTVDTRSIEIDATPDDIWPWLLQMGYGRAGWYSYDAIDMAGVSSRRILPEWQGLAVGDVVPTHPGGGFEVRVLEPGRALVLYADTGLVTRQEQAARESGEERPVANVAVTGGVLAATQPAEFAASWAFILEPIAASRTRLIERFRVSFGETDKPWTALTLPVIGFGVFLMTREQMLGIKDRAEGLARERLVPPAGQGDLPARATEGVTATVPAASN